MKGLDRERLLKWIMSNPRPPASATFTAGDERYVCDLITQVESLVADLERGGIETALKMVTLAKMFLRKQELDGIGLTLEIIGETLRDRRKPK